MIRNDLAPLLSAVQYLSTKLDPQMSILNLNAFLTTAVKEDVKTMTDLRDNLKNYGGTRSNVSRNISYWADKQWRREDGTRPDGHGFVKSIPDPEDYRRRLLILTQKGHAFCDELSNLLGLSSDMEPEPESTASNEEIEDEDEQVRHVEPHEYVVLTLSKSGDGFVVDADSEDFTGSILCSDADEASRVMYGLRVASEVGWIGTAGKPSRNSILTIK